MLLWAGRDCAGAVGHWQDCHVLDCNSTAIEALSLTVSGKLLFSYSMLGQFSASFHSEARFKHETAFCNALDSVDPGFPVCTNVNRGC